MDLYKKFGSKFITSIIFFFEELYINWLPLFSLSLVGYMRQFILTDSELTIW